MLVSPVKGVGGVLSQGETDSTANNLVDAYNSALNADREFYSSEADKERAWQEKMSNSAYQRAAKDLEAAGFNKYALLAGASGGASTGSVGNAATGSSAQGIKDAYEFALNMNNSAVNNITKIFNSASSFIKNLS